MNGVEWGFAHFVLNSIYSLGVSAPLGRVTVRIASSKLPWVLAKLTKCTLQCSTLPQVLAKFKKCTLQAQNYLGSLQSSRNAHCNAQNYLKFLQSSRNAHCKLKIMLGSCKAQETHIASLKLPQVLAKLKKCTLHPWNYIRLLQSSRNSCLMHTWVQLTTKVVWAQYMVQ